MSKLQHTPGLWTVDRGLIITNGMDYPDALDICAVFVEDIDDPFEIEKAKADARLIAAAPEMLKELIDFCAYNCTDCSGHIEGCSETCGLKNAKEIIEKATGMSIEEILK